MSEPEEKPGKSDGSTDSSIIHSFDSSGVSHGIHKVVVSSAAANASEIKMVDYECLEDDSGIIIESSGYKRIEFRVDSLIFQDIDGREHRIEGFGYVRISVHDFS